MSSSFQAGELLALLGLEGLETMAIGVSQRKRTMLGPFLKETIPLEIKKSVVM